MEAVRDALEGVKAPAKWIRPKVVVEEMIATKQAAMAEQMRLQHEQQTAVTNQQTAIAAQEQANAEAGA